MPQTLTKLVQLKISPIRMEMTEILYAPALLTSENVLRSAKIQIIVVNLSKTFQKTTLHAYL